MKAWYEGIYVQEQLQATEAAKPTHVTEVANLGRKLMEINQHICKKKKFFVSRVVSMGTILMNGNELWAKM